MYTVSFWRGCGEKAGKAPPTRCLSHAKLNCTKLHSTGCRLPATSSDSHAGIPHRRRRGAFGAAPPPGGACTAEVAVRKLRAWSTGWVWISLGRVCESYWGGAPHQRALGPKGRRGPLCAGEMGLALERAGTLSRAVVERFFTLVNANLHQRRLCGRVLHWIGRVGGEQHYPLVVSDQRVRLRGAPSGR